MARYIHVVGPNRAGEFTATLPTGETSLLIHWEDLEALKLFWGVERVQGDLINLRRRVRPGACDRIDGPEIPTGLPADVTFSDRFPTPVGDAGG